jgi:arylsulfatase A-like enzyme
MITQLFASLDWLPTLVEIAGGPKGNDLKAQIEKGAYPGIVRTTLDGVNQLDYLTGKTDKSARDYFFYYSGSTPSAVRYKNWKMCYNMTESGAAGWTDPLIAFHWTIVQNIKRDPFEQDVLLGDAKTLANVQGALGAPATAYIYDWNMLPIGQMLWERELMSYKTYPPLQAPATYNLDGILKAIQAANQNMSQ